MKGMLFREDLFEKVVSGEKTMTRRAVGVGRDESEWDLHIKSYKTRGGLCRVGFEKLGHSKETREFELQYQVGDLVYLKEPFRLPKEFDFYSPRYAQTGKVDYRYGASESEENGQWGKWRSKLHMPHKFARYCMRITDVRVERVGWISEADAIKEGVKSKEEFVKLWKSSDPRFTEKDWVLVCEFGYVSLRRFEINI